MKNKASIGFEIRHSSDKTIQKEGILLGAHRDDHYIFFFMQKGEATFMVDFTQIYLCQNSIYYILPGQVHQRITNHNAEGWFIAVDTSLISPEFRAVFEGRLLLQQPIPLFAEEHQKFETLISFLYNHFTNNASKAFSIQLSQSLINSFLALAACHYSDAESASTKLSRPLLITHEFKKLLTENLTTLKSPAGYANLLHISESYLNEALKKITGFPVTYWILNETILEAKRLLYYSRLTVKEIAHQLGYDDHTYFSRLFKKANHITPMEFRTLYRK